MYQARNIVRNCSETKKMITNDEFIYVIKNGNKKKKKADNEIKVEEDEVDGPFNRDNLKPKIKTEKEISLTRVSSNPLDSTRDEPERPKSIAMVYK